MKLIISVLILLPMISIAGPKFNEEQLEWGFIGSAVVNNQVQPLNCVKGEEVLLDLPKPEIVYRLRSIKKDYDDGKSSELIAEMVIIDMKKTLSNVVSNTGYVLSKQICGESFLSTIFYGARFAYTLSLDTAEAEKISTIEMVETDTSRATEFFNQVKALTTNLKTVSGSGVKMTGALEIPDTPMDETFNTYKAKILADKTYRRSISAESSPYPASVLKDFKK